MLDDNRTKEAPVKLPDNQVALLFLEQSVELCKKNGLVCLIQPSGPLLYNNSSFQFRQVLLRKYNVPQIIDFTHISRILFGKNGDVATAAIFIKNEKSKSKDLLHITVRRTKPHKEKLYFELDTYDFHHVPFNLALNDSLIWKSNFLGGSRSHQLVRRISHLRTLGKFLNQGDNAWEFSEGYIVEKNEIGVKRLKLLENKKGVEILSNDELDELEQKIGDIEEKLSNAASGEKDQLEDQLANLLQQKDEQNKEDGLHTFDMYHLFSRWDLILVLAFIIAVLLGTLYFIMSGNRVV